jgi:1-acyl-sn-glycerol-3-phosphate acyltransferase
VKKQYFPDNNYKTDLSGSPSGFLAWFSRSRFVFLLRLFRIVLRSRKLALKGKYNWDEWSRSSIDIMHLLEKSGGEFNIAGLDKLRELDEPVVFVSNHMSTLETFVFPVLIIPFLDASFVVKESLVNFPLFGPIMKSVNPIVVSRDNSKNDLFVVLDKGSELIKSGTSVIVFPQSTRRPYFKISEFNSLAVKLAKKNNVKLVPIAIKTDYWKKGKWLSELGPLDRINKDIFIEFGEPLIIEDSGKETQRKIVDYISSRLSSWGVDVIK